MHRQQLEAREAALAAANDHAVKPTGIVQYQSGGRVIVLADGDAWECCKDFAAPLQPVVVLMSPHRQYASADPEVIPLGSRTVAIQGHLGAFQVILGDALGHAEILKADMVLDVGNIAQLQMQLPPPGYVRVSPIDINSAAIQAELLELVGEFDKPRYFDYDPAICAHAVNGNTVCSRCIDACPADAITSLADKIRVDPHLCQGGGSCASACPSGAIRYAYPSAGDNGNRLRRLLKVFLEQGGVSPVVLFHQADDPIESMLEQHADMLPVCVEEIASVGMELCLSSLAYGARQVVLKVDAEAPASAVKVLQQQLEWLQVLLDGLGKDADSVCLIYRPDEYQSLHQDQRIETALYSMPTNKRQALLQAVDHLYANAPRTRELVNLPAGAPFGTATIDEKSCTLCMACVSACPGNALQDGSNRELPEVSFIESNCLQCGACTVTCPEQAIFITPRLVLERDKRNRSRVLNQDTPFSCIGCGKPFAPTSAIHKMLFKLKDHHMFQTGRALDRLKMCEDCRVADIVQDADAMNGHFDPLNSISGKGLP